MTHHLLNCLCWNVVDFEIYPQRLHSWVCNDMIDRFLSSPQLHLRPVKRPVRHPESFHVSPGSSTSHWVVQHLWQRCQTVHQCGHAEWHQKGFQGHFAGICTNSFALVFQSGWGNKKNWKGFSYRGNNLDNWIIILSLSRSISLSML